MTMWKSIKIYPNQIKYETQAAALIQMPHKSKYDGFDFWHPLKLIREARRSQMLEISYTDEFIFHLKKYGKGKYNSCEVIFTKDITAAELEEVFASNENTYSYETKPPLHVPERIDPENATADESLVDN